MAAVVVAASWGPALLAVVLTVVHGLPFVATGEMVSLYLLNAFVWGAASGLLLARRSSPVAVITAAAAIGSAISAASRQLVRSPGGEWIDPWLATHVIDRVWLPGTLATLCVLPLLLPPRRLGPASRVLVAVGATACVVPLLVSFLREKPGAAPHPLGLGDPGLQTVVSSVFVVALAAGVAVAVVAAGILAWRWRRGDAAQRRGLGWLVLGQTLSILLFAPTFLPWLPLTSQELFRLVPVAPIAGIVFLAAAVVVVGLGGSLRGWEATANRVVVGTLLLAVVVLAYVSIATFLSTVLPVPPMIAGVAGVVVFVLLLDPLRRFLQARVDALVYGDAADPDQLLARLGAVRHDGDLLASLVADVRDALRLGALKVAAGTAPRAAGRHEVVLPLRGPTGGIGWVRGAAPGRQRLDQRTQRVLEGISGVLAVALRLDLANQELGEARDRALTAGEEERRMLRRELHDGLEPALAATAARLARVAERLPEPAPRAELADVRAALALSTTDVRDLARTLLPGALDAGDLDAALRELGERFSSERLTIAVASRAAESLDPARQNALHHLAAEAVLLLRRSSTAGRAELRLDVGVDSARLDLCADAPFALGASAEATLRSLADRADELGGSAVVADGGRAIRVGVPR